MSNDDSSDGSNDAEARRKRATRLREQIAGLTQGKQGQAAPGKAVPDKGGTVQEQADNERTVGPDDPARRPVPRVHHPSPRDFIERRMREIDKGGDGGNGGDGGEGGT